MKLFSSALAKHTLTFVRLSDCIEYLAILAKWAEDEWGYLSNKCVEYREITLHEMSDDLYVGIYAGQPVSMFVLLDKEFTNNRDLVAKELGYIYVEEKYRGLGFSKQIIDEAKRLSIKAGANLILLNTLKPGLNKLYEKHGAKVICEDRCFSHELDALRISLP